jgi:hypothetical protein
MTEQTKAERLADALEAWTLGKPTHHREAAAELRRLHGLNAELLEALRVAVYLNERGIPMTDEELRVARAAIAKAEGEAK